MDLRDYLTIVRKRWTSIVAITLGVLAATLVLTMLTTPTYTARTTVFFAVQGGGSVSDLVQGSTYAEKQVQSYAEVATAPIVLGPVIESLGLAVSVSELAGQVQATVPLGTVIIEIAAVNEDPQRAADIANAVSAELADSVASLSPPGPDGSDSVRATTISPATVPTTATSPNTRRNLALGLVLGLGVGMGVALLREVLNTKVRTEDDIARVTEASVVGTVAYDDDASAHPLIVQADPHSARAEAYRRLRTNLQFLDIADRPHSIVITSSLPGEGKSTTSINLAIALAEAGTRVLLVDADLRRPQIAKYLQLEGHVGLTTVLIGRADLADVVQPWGNGNLNVLPSGQVPPNPSELLGSHAMEKLMAEAATSYDVVLLDSPPLLPVTDSAILAGKAGGALVVVGSDAIHVAQLEDSLESLKSVDARVLGLVLNKVQRKHADRYSAYNYESIYAPRLEQEKRSRRRISSRRSKADAPGAPAPWHDVHPIEATGEPPPITAGTRSSTPTQSDGPPSFPPRHATGSGADRNWRPLPKK